MAKQQIKNWLEKIDPKNSDWGLSNKEYVD